MKAGSFGSRSTADLGRSALASPAANANARLRVPFTHAGTAWTGGPAM